MTGVAAGIVIWTGSTFHEDPGKVYKHDALYMQQYARANANSSIGHKYIEKEEWKQKKIQQRAKKKQANKQGAGLYH